MKSASVLMFGLSLFFGFSSLNYSGALTSKNIEREVKATIIKNEEIITLNGFDPARRGVIATGKRFKTIGTLTNSLSQEVEVHLSVDVSLLSDRNTTNSIFGSVLQIKVDDYIYDIESLSESISFSFIIASEEVQEIEVLYSKSTDNVSLSKIMMSFNAYIVSRDGMISLELNDTETTPFNATLN